MRIGGESVDFILNTKIMVDDMHYFAIYRMLLQNPSDDALEELNVVNSSCDEIEENCGPFCET